MITIEGFNRIKTQTGKTCTAIYFSDDSRPITEGTYCSEVICSDSYADKIMSYYKSGGEIKSGYSPKEKRRFLYIPKEA